MTPQLKVNQNISPCLHPADIAGEACTHPDSEIFTASMAMAKRTFAGRFKFMGSRPDATRVAQ
jgi:hypothetical protein